MARSSLILSGVFILFCFLHINSASANTSTKRKSQQAGGKGYFNGSSMPSKGSQTRKPDVLPQSIFSILSTVFRPAYQVPPIHIALLMDEHSRIIKQAWLMLWYPYITSFREKHQKNKSEYNQVAENILSHLKADYKSYLTSALRKYDQLDKRNKVRYFLSHVQSLLSFSFRYHLNLLKQKVVPVGPLAYTAHEESENEYILQTTTDEITGEEKTEYVISNPNDIRPLSLNIIEKDGKMISLLTPVTFPLNRTEGVLAIAEDNVTIPQADSNANSEDKNSSAAHNKTGADMHGKNALGSNNINKLAVDDFKQSVARDDMKKASHASSSTDSQSATQVTNDIKINSGMKFTENYEDRKIGSNNTDSFIATPIKNDMNSVFEDTDESIELNNDSNVDTDDEPKTKPLNNSMENNSDEENNNEKDNGELESHNSEKNGRGADTRTLKEQNNDLADILAQREAAFDTLLMNIDNKRKNPSDITPDDN